MKVVVKASPSLSFLSLKYLTRSFFINPNVHHYNFLTFPLKMKYKLYYIKKLESYILSFLSYR